MIATTTTTDATARRLRARRDRYDLAAAWLRRRLPAHRHASDATAALWERHDDLVRAVARIDETLATS